MNCRNKKLVEFHSFLMREWEWGRMISCLLHIQKQQLFPARASVRAPLIRTVCEEVWRTMAEMMKICSNIPCSLSWLRQYPAFVNSPLRSTPFLRSACSMYFNYVHDLWQLITIYCPDSYSITIMYILRELSMIKCYRLKNGTKKMFEQSDRCARWKEDFYTFIWLCKYRTQYKYTITPVSLQSSESWRSSSASFSPNGQCR